MNCDEAMGRYLGGDESTPVVEHLATCATCRGRGDALGAGRDLLASPELWADPPESLEDRVVALVAGAPAVAGGNRTRRDRWIGAVSGAAAVLVLVGALALLGPARPDWEVSMPGTPLAPSATSMVAGWNTEAGTAMRVEVEGLGPAPAGTVYELWLSSDSAHVSAGTFVDDGEIEMTIGVRRADYPRVWVTVEPLGAVDGPSGETVLDTGA